MAVKLKISAPLLRWYHQSRRVLPFREDPTPYHVWVSEIMLQQTRVNAVLPYYHRFMQALPDVAALAACGEDTLMKLWEGLGYYSRARNLQKAARQVVACHGGQLPGDYDALLALPGIGEYTAGAIASIVFGLPRVAVDGNVLRVFARLLNDDRDILKPAVKKDLAAEVRRQMPPDAPGDYNQALMELGALVCLPATPDCAACPLQGQCAAKAAGRQAQLPTRAKKPEKPVLPITGLVVLRGRDVLLQQRPPKGLLAGLWQPPLAEGRLAKAQANEFLQSLVPGAQITAPLPPARHVFTHRVWQLAGWLCAAPPNARPTAADCLFATPAQLSAQYALPGAFKAWLPLMQTTGDVNP